MEKFSISSKIHENAQLKSRKGVSRPLNTNPSIKITSDVPLSSNSAILLKNLNFLNCVKNTFKYPDYDYGHKYQQVDFCEKLKLVNQNNEFGH